MDTGDASTQRELRLERETLRDLEPERAEAEAVRGGDTSTCGGRELCLPKTMDMDAFLGRTMMSWGCTGSIRFHRHDDGHEIVFDLHPNNELLEAQEQFFRSQGTK